MAIKIDQHKCNGCGTCMDTCDVGAIYLVDKKAYIDQSLCTVCGSCIEVCPVQAIQLVEKRALQKLPIAEIQSVKTSVLPTIKAAIVTLGSSLLPLLISKISDAITSAVESKPNQSALPKRKTQAAGRQYRRRFRGGA